MDFKRINASVFTTPNGLTWQQDSNGNMGLFATPGGAEYINMLDYVRVTSVGTDDAQFEALAPAGRNSTLILDEVSIATTNIRRPAGSHDISIGENDAGFNERFRIAISSGATGGTISTYKSLPTAGLGVSAIYAAAAQTLKTNVAPPALSYTPPALAGVYRLSGYLDALTAGTMTFKVKITYKDPGGNARTDIPAFYLQNTTALVAGGNSANTAGQYTMMPYTFAIDNSATAITIQDNAGTYTAGTYYWTPILEQLA